MNIPTIVNLTIYNSLPLNKSFKKYILNYYVRMVKNNGDVYATERMKEIREQCLAFRSRPSRMRNPRRTDLKECQISIKNKTILRQLIKYLDAQPHVVLDLLKIYIRPSGKPVMTVEESAVKQRQTLQSASAIKGTTGLNLITQFIQLFKPFPDDTMKRIIKESRKLTANGKEEYRKIFFYLYNKEINRILSINPLTKDAFKSKPKECRLWFFKWKRILKPIFNRTKAPLTIVESSYSHFPQPAMYADFETTEGTSRSFQKDLLKAILYSMLCKKDGDGYKSDRESVLYYNILLEWFAFDNNLTDPEDVIHHWKELSPEAQIAYRDSFESRSKIFEMASTYKWICNNFVDKSMAQWSWGDYLSLWPDREIDWREIAFGICGEIQHIPKKGTVKRRPIAVPNRFMQFVTRPFQKTVEVLLRRMPRDCTYNQDRFDSHIAMTLKTGGYVGSVDLSQATDHLPFRWLDPVFDIWKRHFDQDILNSFIAFNLLSRASWSNNRTPGVWTVGQPLGTAPSFNLLALTHNLLLESLSILSERFDSPYCILGDDVIMTSSIVRKRYIKCMQADSIPLSLHKSYENCLVEFAGKIFIKNQAVLYCSDPVNIRYENLFDYSRATGIPLKWKYLPQKLRNRISLRYADILGDKRTSTLRADAVTYYTPDGFIIPKDPSSELERVVDVMFQLISYEKLHNCGKRPRPSQLDLIRGDPLESQALTALLLSLSEDDKPSPITSPLEDVLYVKTRSKIQDYCQEQGSAEVLTHQYHNGDSTEDEDDGSGTAWVDYNSNSRRYFGKNSWRNDFTRRRFRVLKERFGRHSREQIRRDDLITKNQPWFKAKFRPVTTDLLLTIGSIVADLQVRR